MMSANLQTSFWTSIFFYENYCILNKISLKVVPKSSINNIALSQIMAWFQTDNKPLSQQMMAQFTYTYITRSTDTECHSALMREYSQFQVRLT